jgi:hypothetical protein
VPGSLGIRSFAAFDAGEITDALQFLFQILALASSITAGLMGGGGEEEGENNNLFVGLLAAGSFSSLRVVRLPHALYTRAKSTGACTRL